MKLLNELLVELRQRNVRLWLEGESLKYKAPKGALTPELLADVKAQKADIIAFLKSVQTSVNTSRPPLAPVSDKIAYFPLSLAQQRLWALYQLDPDSGAYNMPMAYRLVGSVNFALLQKSFAAICQRQEILRVRLKVVDGNPCQVVDSTLEPELEIKDLQHVPADRKEADARKFANDEAYKPFDLEKGPLVRMTVFHLDSEMSILLINMHAIICDGSSSDIFLQELVAFYRAFATDEPDLLLPLSVQYTDYAYWQQQWLRGNVYANQLNYWKEQLSGELSLLSLPTDRPRPPISSGRGDRCYQILPKSLNDALNVLSQKCGVTLFMLLLTAFKILMYRYSQQSDILISFASAGRSQVEVERLVGLFSNTLPLRTFPTGYLSFKELVEQVQNIALGAFVNQDIPFDRLITELPIKAHRKRSPLLQITFALNPPWKGEQGGFIDVLPDLQIQSLFGYVHSGRLPYDLTLVMRETPSGLRTIFEYDTDLFDASTIERMIGHFQTILEGIVANPARRISDLPLLTASEQQQLLVEWNQTDTPYPQYASIQQIFEAQVAATPEAIALVSEEIKLTYQDLNQQANQLAHFLRQLGVITETPVGICLDRSPAALIAILGVLKAGGIYVPLNPRASMEQLTYVLEETQAIVVLTQQSLATHLAGVSPKVIYLDAESATLQQQSQENPPHAATANTIASILYSNKADQAIRSSPGVCITHRGVVQLVKGNPQWKLAADTKLLHWSSITSEIALFEQFGALLNGGTIVIAAAETSGKQLGILIQAHQVNTLWLPTCLLHHLIRDDLDQLQSVKTLLIGSDVLSVASMQKLLSTLPNCTLFKVFSLPENTGFTCSYALQAPVPTNVAQMLGTPLGNTQVYVLDQHQQPVPVGVVGELYVAGAGLAKGYYHRPDLTTDRFGVNPFNRASDARLYKTGYLVRYLPDGNLEQVGFTAVSAIAPEIDLQAHRLTVALHQHPKILEAVVVVREELSPGENYVAYIIPASLPAPDASELRDFLKQQGITQQLPIAFVSLSALPITSEGAVDDQELPVPDVASQDAEINVVAARNDLEEKLVAIWEEILGTQPIGIQDNYFELAGNSLQAVQLFARIEQVTGKNLPLATLFQAPTIEKLAKMLGQEEDSVSWSSLVPIQASGTKLPFFCIHGLGGDVLSFYDLSHHLGQDQPFYGLQAQGLDGDKQPFTRVEDMAAHYIQEIRTVQPQGPYLLGGLSSGGTIAFEMARQLQAQDQEVALVVLLDTLGPKYYKPLSFRDWLARHTGNFLKTRQEDRISYLLGGLKAWKSRLKNRFFQKSDKNKGQPDLTAQPNQPVNFVKIKASNGEEYYLRDSGILSATTQAIQDYAPEPYSGRCLMLRSKEKSWWSNTDTDLGWGNLLDHQQLEIYEVTGHHFNIFLEPNVTAIVEKLRRCFEEVSFKT